MPRGTLWKETRRRPGKPRNRREETGGRGELTGLRLGQKEAEEAGGQEAAKEEKSAGRGS